MIETETSPKVFQGRFPLVVIFLSLLLVSTFVLSFLYFQRENKLKSKHQTPGQPLISSITSSPTPGPTSTPTPTPTPLIGPGPYACDNFGICNIYEDKTRVGCPKTYADPHCLGECGEKTVRCPK